MDLNSVLIFYVVNTDIHKLNCCGVLFKSVKGYRMQKFEDHWYKKLTKGISYKILLSE